MAKKMRRMKHNRLAAVAALATMAAYPAYAQRASENAVNSAGDAFGVSIGSETVGIRREYRRGNLVDQHRRAVITIAPTHRC